MRRDLENIEGSIKKAIKFVQENYKIMRDKIFILGTSSDFGIDLIKLLKKKKVNRFTLLYWKT